MTPSRQMIMWSVPSIAVLLGIFWLRKKKDAKCDPGGRKRMKNLKEELAEAFRAEVEALKSSPIGKADRAIIKSAPIDIVPNGSSSLRSSPLQLTDEEVDLEIDKIIRKKSIEKEKNPLNSIDMQSNLEMHKNETWEKSLSPDNETNVVNEFVSVNKSSLFEACPNLIHSETDKAQNNDNCLKNNNDCDHIEKPEETDEEVITEIETNVHIDNDVDSELNDNLLIEPTNHNSDTKEFTAQPSRHLSERDSANHSPMDPLLASPSACHFSDNHSEGSSDSGKGCSEAASPPPTTLNIMPDTGLRIHQFLIQQSLVGLLIGRHGAFVTQIKGKTGATVFVKQHPDSNKVKICAIEGTQSEIEAALDMIKDKFPERKFPQFSTQEISAELVQRLYTFPFVPDFIQMHLIDSVNNDTIITCLVSAGHFFLQQPLHPAFPSLHALHRNMAKVYQNPDVPSLPRPIKEDTICVAPTENNWYRAQVVSTSEETDTSVVKLVDFGGYLTLDNDQLKQIRKDFMQLAFQASEAFLAFVKPSKNESEWSGEALRIMAGLTAGRLLQAQVAGYNEFGLPLVHLYVSIGSQQIIFLNQELVDRGLAEWDLPVES